MGEINDCSAVENGFTSFDRFLEAWKKGFTEAALYSVALEKGYCDMETFTAGQQKGFLTFEEYKRAQEIGAADMDDLLKYWELELPEKSDLDHSQRLLLLLISKLPQGKKISLNKLHDLFSETLGSYKYSDSLRMPTWFTSSYTDQSSLVSFLTQNSQISAYGVYDADGEYIETRRLEERKIVIDGSNVAHGTANGNGQSKPTVGNLILLTGQLRQKGFSDITVIADASLKHRLQDHERLPELKDVSQYLEAPAEYAADAFLLQFVKQERCLLVSNDTFRDSKVKDRWVAENIDYYRMSFMFKGETVLLPDIS